jgi:hypothetical protein
MTDQSTIAKVNALEKVVNDGDDRTRRVGERLEELRESVQTDINVRLATVEERTRNILWAAGIGAAALLAICTQLYSLNGRLTGIERDVAHIGSALADLQLKRASQNISNPKSVPEVKQVLADAKNGRIKIPSTTVASEGSKFIEAAIANPDAWSAALAFLEYRSFLNPGLVSLDVKHALEDKNIGTAYSQWTPTGESGTTALLKAYGSAPLVEGAVMTPIGFVTRGASHGNKFIVLYDGDVVLDNTEFKHVIISGAHVIWGGRATILQDVYFINCTFDLPKTRGQSLATAILDNTSVNFQTS